MLIGGKEGREGEGVEATSSQTFCFRPGMASSLTVVTVGNSFSPKSPSPSSLFTVARCVFLEIHLPPYRILTHLLNPPCRSEHR